MDTAVQVPIAPLGFVDKLRVVIASLAAIVLMTTVGWTVARPLDPEMGVLLVTHWGGVLGVWPAMIALSAVAAALGTAISGRRLPEAGVFAAAVGLVGLALQGGSMQEVLAYVGSNDAAGRRALMVRLTADTLLWSAVLAVAWMVVLIVRRWLWPNDAPTTGIAAKPSGKSPTTPVREQPGWAVLAVTGLVAVFFIYLTIARTPVAEVARKQVIASVATGFYLGAMAARYFLGGTRAEWYVLAAPAGALLAYLVGYLNAGMGWTQGTIWQPYADLATTPPHNVVRPLPVEYVAVGVAAALAGFWSGEKIEHVADQETK